MKDLINHYNAWAVQYDEDINRTRDLDKMVTIESLSSIDFLEVLELGCGTGKNSEWLITRADRLVGLDFSKNMLDRAKNKIKSDKATFIRADLNENWPVKDNSFDLVVINLTLEHIENLNHVFNSLFKKLNEGGKCFVSELHPKRQLAGSKAKFFNMGKEVVLDVFLHLEEDYVQCAERSGLTLRAKKDHFDKEEDIPRLISFLFEKPKQP
tara:strand:- start:11 stop:643 length:633 start_codon:yes stop_codon:yes gene_type:complete